MSSQGEKTGAWLTVIGLVAGIAMGIAGLLAGWIIAGIIGLFQVGYGIKKIINYYQEKNKEEAEKVAEKEEEAKKAQEYKKLEELYEKYGCMSKEDAEKLSQEDRKDWERAQVYKQERKDAYFKFVAIKLTTREAVRVLTNDEFRDWRKYLAVKKEREDAKEVYEQYKDKPYEEAKNLVQSELKKWYTVQDLKKEKADIEDARKEKEGNTAKYQKVKDLINDEDFVGRRQRLKSMNIITLEDDEDEDEEEEKKNIINNLKPEEKELLDKLKLLERFELKKRREENEKFYDENKGLPDEQVKEKFKNEAGYLVWKMDKYEREQECLEYTNNEGGDFKENGHKKAWQYGQAYDTEVEKYVRYAACWIYVKFKHIQTEDEARKLGKDDYENWKKVFKGDLTWGKNGSLKGFKYEGKYDPEEIYDKYKDMEEKDAELTLDREEFKKWDFVQSLKKAKEEYNKLKQLEINNENNIIENKISKMDGHMDNVRGVNNENKNEDNVFKK